jgi:hypothetical protein
MKLAWAREGPNQYWRAGIALLPLYLWAEIVPVNDAEEDEAQFEVHVVAEVRNVNGSDEQVGLDSMSLPDFDPWEGDPNEDVALNAMVEDTIMALNARVHGDVRRELEGLEGEVKRLRAVERQMSRVTLIAGDFESRVTVTPELARMVLALKGEAAQIPHRMQLEAPNVVACYNAQNFLLGRIIYRPELANGQSDRPGRLGLYLFSEEDEQ